MVSKKGSMDRALRDCVLAKDGPLYAEARFLLQDEVSTPNVYWSLLHAIGSGVHRISEIAGRMSLPANGLTRYLAALQDLGLVRREVPVTEPSPERSKRGIYQVTDPFLHLWSGCVVPFESLLEFGKVKEVETLARERLVAHQAWAFEIAAREYVENHAQDFGVVKVGRYWDRSTEVDVVGTDGRGKPVFAAECKWSDRPLGRAVGVELETRVARLWPEQVRRLRLAVVSSGGFSPGLRKWAGERGALLVGCEELLE
jgi:AAA+ ATPase superfamily predicted ATPase